MFEVDIKINGCLIGHVYGHNKGRSSFKEEDSYFYRYYEVQNGATYEGELTHSREEGIEPLVQKIFNKIVSQKGAKNG